MRFGSAVITKLNDNTFVMKITNYWLYFLPYIDTYVFTSLAECKTKLIQIRCRDHISIVNGINGEEQNLKIFDKISNEKIEEKQNTNIPNIPNPRLNPRLNQPH